MFVVKLHEKKICISMQKIRERKKRYTLYCSDRDNGHIKLFFTMKLFL